MTQILLAEPEGFAPRARLTLDGIGTVTEACSHGELTEGDLADAEVLWVRLGLVIDGALLDSAPKLGFVVSATTGLDHIDLEACAQRGVEVLSLRGESEFLRTISSTAEHTWALLLALLRKIPAAHRSVLSGEWDRDRFRGNQLADQVLGIVGVGRVGTMVARYGRAFDMEVCGYDPAPEAWPDGVRRTDSLTELLSNSDVVSVHVPLDDSTVKLLDAAALAPMRSHAVLINTSRGEVIDETALLAMLDEQRLAGAALDVLCGENDPDHTSPLVSYASRHDNLVISPHIGGATIEAMRSTETFMAEKLHRALAAKGASS